MPDTTDPERRDDAPVPDERRPAPAEGPYPRLLHHQLLTPTAPLAPGAAIRVVPLPVGPVPGSSVPAVWAPDPTGRHQWRWWSGAGWTDHVADDGVAAEDPLGDG